MEKRKKQDFGGENGKRKLFGQAWTLALTLLRVIPTMTSIRFVTGKSSGNSEKI
jgi:hypothetical protein